MEEAANPKAVEEAANPKAVEEPAEEEPAEEDPAEDMSVQVDPEEICTGQGSPTGDEEVEHHFLINSLFTFRHFFLRHLLVI